VNPTAPIAATGEIHDSTPGAVLRWCESSRFTGTLRFTTNDETAEIPMLGGAPEVHDADDPVARLVERFTSLRAGTYALTQCLPPIEGATAASEFEREGALAEFSAGDLMQYAEATGLSGELVFRQDDPEPCSFRAVYDRGALVSITCDGATQDPAEVTSIFFWKTGVWSLRAEPLLNAAQPNEEKPAKSDTPLLRTVEVALAEILAQRDATKTTSWRPPSFRPAGGEVPSEIIPRAPKVPKAFGGGGADTTVKVYFVQPRRTPEAAIPAQKTEPDAPKPDAPAATSPSPRSDPGARASASRTEFLLWAILAVCALIALVSIADLVARS
jgi:hypothetical protein